jgi:hypothetical protein
LVVTDHIQAVLRSRNYFFGCGSDFQKVSAPGPAPAPIKFCGYLFSQLLNEKVGFS